MQCQRWLLIGRSEIARVFGTTKKTVTRWAREGAPIFWVGRRMQADYEHLLIWLEQEKRVSRVDGSWDRM